MGFFLTPIIWNIDQIPEKYHIILKLNPAYYFVEGYRNSLIYKIPFWEMKFETIYFWLFTFIFMFLGMIVFKRTKPHFADVL
jgi:ABC-type polysaccharide/polyol phosphate export permease